MSSTKKLFAAVTNSDFRVSVRVEIKDETDAVQKTLQNHGIYFSTYEVESVTLGGKELKGEPENYSKHRFVGIDKIYSRDEVIASMEEDAKHSDKFMARAIRSVIEVYKSKSANSVHITGFERQGEFIEIEAGEKVFDRTGQQLWPKQTTPASVPKPKLG